MKNTKNRIKQMIKVLFICIVSVIIICATDNTAAASGEIQRDFWISATDTNQSAEIRVRADKKLEDDIIYFEISTDGLKYDDVTYGVHYQKDDYDSDGIYCHFYRIYGLAPSTTYYIRISEGARSTEPKTFTTAPDQVNIHLTDLTSGQYIFNIEGTAETFNVVYLDGLTSREINTAENIFTILSNKKIQIVSITAKTGFVSTTTNFNKMYYPIPKKWKMSLSANVKERRFNLNIDQTKGIAGYDYEIFEVRKGKAKKIISDTSTSLKNVIPYKKIKKGMIYRIKIRTYIENENNKYYSEWKKTEFNLNYSRNSI